MNGFILLHRALLENAIFYKPDYFQIWIYILLKVNHKENEFIWNGEKKIVDKGCGIFSQKKISDELKIAIGTVHNALKYLKSENQIEINSTNRYTEIKVVNWDKYQDLESISENRMKSRRKQNENTVKQTNMINMINMINIEEEAKKFVSEYGQEMINDFLRFWTEKDSKGKEKWQKQETWETARRLVTWKKKAEEFNKKKFLPSTPKPSIIV